VAIAPIGQGFADGLAFCLGNRGQKTAYLCWGLVTHACKFVGGEDPWAVAPYTDDCRRQHQDAKRDRDLSNASGTSTDECPDSLSEEHPRQAYGIFEMKLSR